MAEIVQQNLESMLPELEQLERVQLLKHDEVKEVVKRRKGFEYALQKRQKRKSDFLVYVQYEIALFDLIALRRKKLGYSHKTNDIENKMAKRINKLFRIVEHRFGHDDVDVFYSHVAFLNKVKWFEKASSVFLAATRKHAHNERLWADAANAHFEAEDEKRSSEAARSTFFNGLRFNPTSKLLYREVNSQHANWH